MVVWWVWLLCRRPELASFHRHAMVFSFLFTVWSFPNLNYTVITEHRYCTKLEYEKFNVKNHSLTSSSSKPRRPWPIVVKFKHFKQREMVRSLTKWLKNKPFVINEQYPQEIMDKRKVLFPIFRSKKAKNNQVSLNRDKLFININLFRDLSLTPRLYK